MDIRLKKTALAAVLGLGIAGVANAAGFTPPPACTSHPVTIPCENEAWDVAIEGLYWKPIVHEKTTYFVEETATNEFKLRRVEPKFKFGFRVEGSYHFSTGNDLTVNWTHLNASRTRDHDLTAFVDPVWAWAGGAADTNIWAKNRVRFDAVNAEFGQHFDVGNNLDIRVHGGVQYGRIDAEQHVKIHATAGADIDDWFHETSESDFRGFGPRVGMDWNYHLGNGVDFVARFAGEILIGNLDSDFWLGFHDESNNANDYLLHADGGSRCAVVPGGEGRLGLSYTHDMNDEGRVILEGGWHAAAYTNAIMHLPQHPITATVAGFNSLHDTSSYGQHGPYLMLKYISNKV